MLGQFLHFTLKTCRGGTEKHILDILMCKLVGSVGLGNIGKPGTGRLRLVGDER